jgi:hypothetical protein
VAEIEIRTPLSIALYAKEDGPRSNSAGVERYTKINLLPTANLVVAYGIFPGRLKKDLCVF